MSSMSTETSTDERQEWPVRLTLAGEAAQVAEQLADLVRRLAAAAARDLRPEADESAPELQASAQEGGTFRAAAALDREQGRLEVALEGRWDGASAPPEQWTLVCRLRPAEPVGARDELRVYLLLVLLLFGSSGAAAAAWHWVGSPLWALGAFFAAAALLLAVAVAVTIRASRRARTAPAALEPGRWEDAVRRAAGQLDELALRD